MSSSRRYRSRRVQRCLAAALLLHGAATAKDAVAGAYVAPGIRWAAVAPRPVDGEDTPNYYGYGGALSLGYSIQQAVDIGAYGTYIPTRRGPAEFGTDDASLVFYGGELACRFADSVYIGLRGGASTYQLYKQTDDDGVRGVWSGPGGGLSIGAVAKLSKQSFFLTTFDMLHHVMTAEDKENGTGKRRFDTFSISLTYMFNNKDDYVFQNSVFKDFLDSIVFF